MKKVNTNQLTTLITLQGILFAMDVTLISIDFGMILKLDNLFLIEQKYEESLKKCI